MHTFVMNSKNNRLILIERVKFGFVFLYGILKRNVALMIPPFSRGLRADRVKGIYFLVHPITLN